jgi:Dit-like phage tail protein
MNVREVISIFYPESKARLGELVVDAYINEVHTFSSAITEHPVEGGLTIVDHVHNQPFCLSIDGIISNTPMNLIGLTAFDSAKRYLDGESNDFSLIAFEKIEDIFKKREPISIATSLKTYHKMVLESLSVERGGGSQTLRFSCTAKQIRTVYQERIQIAVPKVSRAQPKQKKGLQETKPPSKEKVEAIKKEKTWLKSLFGDISLKPGNIE